MKKSPWVGSFTAKPQLYPYQNLMRGAAPRLDETGFADWCTTLIRQIHHWETREIGGGG
jgi:hypothetical protein